MGQEARPDLDESFEEFYLFCGRLLFGLCFFADVLQYIEIS